MNRIILIGNGFDLTHGKLTSYKNFLNDYWTNTIIEIKKLGNGRRFENDEIIIQVTPSISITENPYDELRKKTGNNQTSIEFKNKFLQILSEKSLLLSWVDIENEYYFLLKKSYIDKSDPKYIFQITNLNKDLDHIKGLLEEYLIRIEEDYIENNTTKNKIGHIIYYPFDLKDFSENSFNKLVDIEYDSIKECLDQLNQDSISMDDLDGKMRGIIERLGDEDHHVKLKNLLMTRDSLNYFELVPDQTLFLNFNYTFTDLIYKNPNEFDTFNFNKLTKSDVIRIHGTINKYDDNPIIFGFGDELDDDYRSIERLNNNEYLENIKSINYLETDNYKKLLKFINNEDYQVFIFGHSCGISDRTLLNTIFEHDNCGSIKFFYHKKGDSVDNYKDVIQNISRNFNDKTKMRDRVVNKSYSEPLI